MQDSPGVFGVDVAKAEVVVAAADERMPRKAICNERKALAAWLHTLPAGSIVAMESTGMHHRLLAELAHAAGMRVYVLNARDVYFYARALGARSKTDRVDAAIIARYAAEHHARLHAWQPAAGVYEQAMEHLRPSPVIAIALNTFDLSDAQAQAAVDRVSEETGLPTTDPVRFDPSPIAQAISRFHNARLATG